MHEFRAYSDQDIGGDSTGELVYDGHRGCLVLKGEVRTKNKERLSQHPSIGMARAHPYKLKCGPFNAIQLEIESDGHPIQVGVELESQIEGKIGCYGNITSKLKGWNIYEVLLFPNTAPFPKHAHGGCLGRPSSFQQLPDPRPIQQLLRPGFLRCQAGSAH